MNEVHIFKNPEFGEVRTIAKDNEPWFVGKDVAEILGYERPTKAINDHVDSEDKDAVPIQDSIGRKQKTPVINESGLYSLILSSKLPRAKKFKRWVTSEVLPQIRKTGGYISVEKGDSDEAIMAKALLIAQNTIAKKDELLKKQSVELESKNKFIMQIAVSQNSLLVRDVAKIASNNNIMIGEKRLWAKLREWDMIFKKTTEPKQEYIDRGYFEIVEGSRESSKGTFVYTTTRVTGKGQVYIINRLIKENEEVM